MDYINQHQWPPLSYEQAMEEYRKKYLEEAESDESGEEDNELEREGGREGGTSAEGGQRKSSGYNEKRKLRTGRNGSVAGRRRTHKTAAIAGGRGRTNNKCRVM